MDVEETIDLLYSLPAGEFTAARKAAARELREAGRRAEATRIEEQRKPAAAAAAVNHLVRSEGKQVELFLDAAAALRDAQLAGSENIESATRTERELLARLVRAGGSEVRQSLQAAAVDQAAATRLLEGRLTRELEPSGFGTLFDHAKAVTAKPAASRGVTRAKKQARTDDRPERARLAETKKRLAAARSFAQRAERDWDRARAELALAEGQVEKAQAELERVRNG